MPMREKFLDYLRLMRLHKPVGIWLLLWPTLWGLWFAAQGTPDFTVLWVFIAGVVLMRSAGCAINDVFDKDFDPHVARTKDRPIAAGRVSRSEGLRLFVAIALIAYGLTTQLNTLTVLMSLPAVALAASYPLMKRLIALPQAYLGLAFSWGIPMAWTALHGRVDWPLALTLMAANIAWVIAYDTLYAMVDREDDLKIGVKSAAILFGRYDLAAVAVLQALCLLLMAFAGRDLAWPYWLGWAAAAGWAVRISCLARTRAPADCFKAFLQSHWLGALLLIGVVAATALPV